MVTFRGDPEAVADSPSYVFVVGPKRHPVKMAISALTFSRPFKMLSYSVIMGRIIVVRHGQASYGQQDYDRLSDLGVRQCEMLGRYWAARGLRPDRVVVGPRRRHWQSHAAITAGFHATANGNGAPWPDPVEDPGLDEYQAFEVMDTHAPVHRELLADSSVGPEEGRRRYFLLYRQTMRRWLRGEFPDDGIESWPRFRARVESSVEQWRQSLTNGSADGNRTIMAITSGGPMAAAAGYVLGMDDLRTMEQSWMISNGSFSEFMVSRSAHEDRFSMVSFNATPHLDPELVTGA
jgi:broad specificity phosphatase PhoE